jgi:hypothetical protein
MKQSNRVRKSFDKLATFLEVFRKDSLSVSKDEIAIVGKNDYLFLYKGFNRYYQMYFDGDDLVQEMMRKWKVSINSWRESVESKNATFFFILIPNKATLLRDFYPLPLPKVGTQYLSLLTKIESIQVFSPEDTEDIFLRNDTHLSPKGNFELARFMLNALNCNYDFGELIPKGFEKVVGDLGSKFKPAISESVQYFENSNSAIKPKIVNDNSSEYLPERRIGISISFINSGAPLKKSLKIFGNSFLGVASEYSSLWLLALAFENVTFHWSPVVLIEHIEEQDIVIFQTCERFLGYSPDHWL